MELEMDMETLDMDTETLEMELVMKMETLFQVMELEILEA